MTFPDVISLVDETQPRGVLEMPASSTHHQVYCTVRSVGMNEAYRAMSNGLHPTLVFDLTDYSDYHGEKIVVYQNKRYRIVRTFRSNQGIELTCEEATIDA